MNLKGLVKTWDLPNLSNERIQVTLRLQFDNYAKLHALKEVYPRQSVNDIITDIIRLGLDEIIEALPTYVVSERFLQDRPYMDMEVGDMYGPAISFQSAYRRILESKSQEEKEKEKEKESAS